MALFTTLTVGNRTTKRYKNELVHQVGTLQSLTPLVIAPTGTSVYEVSVDTYEYEYPGIASGSAPGLVAALRASNANSIDAWAEQTSPVSHSIFHTVQTRTYVRQIS